MREALLAASLRPGAVTLAPGMATKSPQQPVPGEASRCPWCLCPRRDGACDRSREEGSKQASVAPDGAACVAIPVVANGTRLMNGRARFLGGRAERCPRSIMPAACIMQIDRRRRRLVPRPQLLLRRVWPRLCTRRCSLTQLLRSHFARPPA